MNERKGKMYTVFACRSCGFEWDCEGTPHGDCPECGGEGVLTHQNGVDYCWRCGKPEDECQYWGEEEADKPDNNALHTDGGMVQADPGDQPASVEKARSHRRQ